MLKKLIALMLVCVLAFTSLAMLSGCTDETGDGDDSGGKSDGDGESGPYGFEGTKTLADPGCVYTTADDVAEGTAGTLKVGVILVGDSTEGYTEAHIEGLQTALTALGVDYSDESNVIWKYFVKEDDSCASTAEDLVAQGCNVVISNSYGHQDYMKASAAKYPDVQFIAMTGDTAATAGLDNFSNAFTEVYQSRYVSGVIAGMKLKELIDEDKIPAEGKDADGNIKIGYVGAFNYAEVVSGYTAFYLGIKSVVSNVVMEVQYTNEWYDWDGENEAAKNLIANGCVIIGQHADSTGAPTAINEAYNSGKVVYSVGYNIDMTDIGDAVLTSSTNNWSVFYEYALKTVLYGGKVASNWTGGYAQGAVATTTLGTQVASGTQEKIDETVAALVAGTLHVFDTSKFTVGGKTVTYAYATDTNGDWTNDANNVIADGYYHESYVQSAPSFSLRIDGITEPTESK